MIYASYVSSNGERSIYSLPDGTPLKGYYFGRETVILCGNGTPLINTSGSIEIYSAPDSPVAK